MKPSMNAVKRKTMFNFRTKSGMKLTEAARDCVNHCMKMIPVGHADYADAKRLVAMDISEELDVGQFAVVIKAESIIYEQAMSQLGFVHPILRKDMEYVQHCIREFMTANKIVSQSDFDNQINALYSLNR